MNAWDDARKVEADSRVALEPFLRETQGRYVFTDKGNAARFLQETLGDMMFNARNGTLFTVEVKAETRPWTGNLFLETWSNRNFDDPVSHAQHGSKPGWLVTQRADLLFYHFPKIDRLFICNMLALKRWAFVAPSKNMSEQVGNRRCSPLPGRIYDFPELEQKAREQPNTTCGRIVPISMLMQEISPTPRLVGVRQLSLSLFGAEAA